MAESSIRTIINYKVAYRSKIFIDATGGQDMTLKVDDQFPSDARVGRFEAPHQALVKVTLLKEV